MLKILKTQFSISYLASELHLSTTHLLLSPSLGFLFLPQTLCPRIDFAFTFLFKMTSMAAQVHILAATGFCAPSSTKPTNFFPRTFFLGHGFIRTTLHNLTISPSRFDVSPHAKANPTGEQKWTHEGSVTESLPNGMFRVRLDNEDVIIGYISGKIRKNFVRILPGDRVKVEVSRYDSSRGRIVYRMRNRDTGNDWFVDFFL